jgi:hypothetical protein
VSGHVAIRMLNCRAKDELRVCNGFERNRLRGFFEHDGFADGNFWRFFDGALMPFDPSDD